MIMIHPSMYDGMDGWMIQPRSPRTATVTVTLTLTLTLTLTVTVTVTSTHTPNTPHVVTPGQLAHPHTHTP